MKIITDFNTVTIPNKTLKYIKGVGLFNRELLKNEILEMYKKHKNKI